MAELGTELEIDPGDDSVRLTGEIDAHTAPELERVLNRILETGSEAVVVHMGGVTFMDSSGLQVVIAATGRARDNGGDLVLEAPTSAVRSLIEVTGLGDHLTLRDTTE